MPLCNELEITVNELLVGERVSEEDYQKKAEENMVNLIREKQESKKKIILATATATLAVVSALTLFALSKGLEMETWLRIVLIVIGILVITSGIASL